MDYEVNEYGLYHKVSADFKQDNDMATLNIGGIKANAPSRWRLEAGVKGRGHSSNAGER